MKRILSSAFVVLMLTLSLNAQTAPDGAELTKLLNDFLAGASRNDAATHERFWADDLIYTGSSGRRVSKADILKDVRSPAHPPEQAIMYAAEDIRINQYGDTAIVAFRLIGKVEKGAQAEITRYLNTGTFLKRKGKWQAVSWQATRMPRAEEEAKRELASVEAAFHQATLAADINMLAPVLDESFIWTHSNGDQVTRAQLLEHLRTGQLKFLKLETSNMKISVSGDTGIVRGITVRQRSAIAGATGVGDPVPFTAYYTLTFINKGGPWKAVAMHTSRQ
jgi:ketosteroid isomerase-like protein